MQAAQETARDLRGDDTPEPNTVRVDRVAALKPEINSLVHVSLPETMTMRDADIISNLILDILLRPQYYTAPDSAASAQPIVVESPEAAGRGLATESGVGLPADAPKP